MWHKKSTSTFQENEEINRGGKKYHAQEVTYEPQKNAVPHVPSA